MPTSSFTLNYQAGGVQFSTAISRTADHPNPYEIDLPAGNAGTLSTRTDAETGTLTLGGSHTIQTADVIDLYWDGGVRYGITVGTVAGTSVPIGADNSGAGDDLPTQGTAIVATKQVEINTTIDGDAIQCIGICATFVNLLSTAKVHADFQSVDPATVAELDFVANVGRIWDVAGGSDNPFEGDPIVKCYASNGSDTDVCVLKIGSMEDATP